ncbi:DUF502 domain-containing protein [Telmatospirillum siberiense]|uniref:DUF502 domain-containing protein n=1 Tax=Telmatospirillum siberiense TaxID=382514 RepID=A0A2N3PS66_9PROT|nr:DUF502 domain-containing protein [Telmatospirillum siberiense]PKU23251.1 hypothetical protein CWS72_17655 [Telmatospirillum siberiense]
MTEPNHDAPPTADTGGHVTLVGRLRAYFFAGVLITAPISITFYIAWLFVDFVDRQVTPLLPASMNPALWGVHGFGLLLVVAALTVVGALTAGFLGRVWLRFSEAIMQRTPVLRGIYSAVKQIFETVLAQKSQAFREVVLIEYPRRGIWTVAFITGQTVGAISRPVGIDLVNVFVPTTPNPTSGFLLFLPRSDVHLLDLSVEDGLKLVISGGIVAPPERRPVDDWENIPMA